MARTLLAVVCALVVAAPAQAREVARGDVSEPALAGHRIVWAEGDGAGERVAGARAGRRFVLRRLGPPDRESFVTDLAGSRALVAYERANIADNGLESGSDRREIVALHAGRATRLFSCRRFDEGELGMTGVRVAGRRVAYGLGACGYNRIRVSTLGRGGRWRTTTYAAGGFVRDLHLAGHHLGLRRMDGSVRVIDLRTRRTVTRYGFAMVSESTLLADGTIVVAHEYGDGRLRFVAPGASRGRAFGRPFYESLFAAGRRVAVERTLYAGETARERQILTLTPRRRRAVQVQARFSRSPERRLLADADARCLVWIRLAPSSPDWVISARPIHGTRGTPACRG